MEGNAVDLGMFLMITLPLFELFNDNLTTVRTI
jgi:hypothetical protein